eukprot:967354-Lingulodinium_polyedra.AAC.1
MHEELLRQVRVLGALQFPEGGPTVVVHGRVEPTAQHKGVVRIRCVEAKHLEALCHHTLLLLLCGP